MDGDPIIEGGDHLAACVAAFARAPRLGALFCDIDGTISPIARRPDEAIVPPETRSLLSALTARLGLVVFVTGRALEDGRRLAGVDGAAYVGAHGLEWMRAGETPVREPRAERYVAAVHDVAEAAARDLDCEALGIVLEDKRAVLAIHYRLAEDPAKTRHEILTRVVDPARARGLAISTGHFTFEVRPPLPFSKGTLVRRFLSEGDYAAALVCGDDLTDVTAFRDVHAWGERDARRAACALAAITVETPRPVRDEADVLVCGTPGVRQALARLLEAVGGG